jgi:hypothetical protein
MSPTRALEQLDVRCRREGDRPARFGESYVPARISCRRLSVQVASTSASRSDLFIPAKTDGLRDRVRGNWWGQPSNGNHAFDDYRAETLRRLEDEQREFKEFLKRLARDRAEFDQFMNDRHSTPSASRRAI